MNFNGIFSHFFFLKFICVNCPWFLISQMEHLFSIYRLNADRSFNLGCAGLALGGIHIKDHLRLTELYRRFNTD